MDYESAYKQALERAKQFSEKPYQEDSAGIVEYIFPELKESEDERIRKELIDYFSASHATDTFRGISWDRVVSWLEKQGEQKPAEWDESIIDETISLINMLASGYGKKVDEPITFNGVKMINNIEERLRAIKPQPKQEWSEVDEKMHAAVLQLITDSEKENGWNCVYCNDKEIYFSDIIAWLKSLRPQNTWKPSKEQIEAVKCAALDVSKLSSRSEQLMLENEPYYKALVSLYQDLKKLMEE